MLKSFLVGSAGWQGVPHREAIAAVRAAGFGGIEILCKSGHFEPDNSVHVDEVRSALENWPEAIVTFHAPFHTVDLSSTDSATWDHAVSCVALSLRTALTFRAESATIHTRGGGEGKNWGGDNLPAFQRALQALVPVAAECKMTLSVENMPPPRFATDAEDLLGLLATYPADLVGVCFDTGHAHLAGTVVQVAGALAPRAFIMHIHDNHAVEKDEHNIPGQGTIPWPEVVSALRTNGFRGRNVMEVLKRNSEGDTIDTVRNTLDSMRNAILQTGLSDLNGRCDHNE